MRKSLGGRGALQSGYRVQGSGGKQSRAAATSQAPREDCDPLVTIALPVYNGARYLSRAIESVLNQSFADFELVISDNASTDETEAICRQYAAADSRIRYYRNRRNLGAAGNYNHLVWLARGRYFKWISHDDQMHKEFLAATVSEITTDESIITVATDLVVVDTAFRTRQVVRSYVGRNDWPLDRLEQYKVMMRELAYCETHNDGLFMVAYEYGLHRTKLLRTTSLIGSYIGSDYVLAAELSLLGTLRHIPAPLNTFMVGTSEGGTSANFHRWNPGNIMAMLDPAKKRGAALVIAQRRRHWEHIRAVAESPLPPRVKTSALRYAALPAFFRARARVRRSVVRLSRALRFRRGRS